MYVCRGCGGGLTLTNGSPASTALLEQGSGACTDVTGTARHIYRV